MQVIWASAEVASRAGTRVRRERILGRTLVDSFGGRKNIRCDQNSDEEKELDLPLPEQRASDCLKSLGESHVATSELSGTKQKRIYLACSATGSYRAPTLDSCGSANSDFLRVLPASLATYLVVTELRRCW